MPEPVWVLVSVPVPLLLGVWEGDSPASTGIEHPVVQINPLGQGWQAVLPDVPAKVPDAQGSHVDAPPVEKLPGPHWVGVADPDGQELPGGQITGVDVPVGQKFPTGQNWQAVLPAVEE